MVSRFLEEELREYKNQLDTVEWCISSGYEKITDLYKQIGKDEETVKELKGMIEIIEAKLAC